MSGRIRTLKPELLEDEKLSNLEAGARFLFVACILLSDDHGGFRAAPAFLAGQAFWGHGKEARKVPVWFAQLVELGFIRTYVVRGQQFGQIANWKKHQKIDHPGAPRHPTPDEADAFEAAVFDDPKNPLATSSKSLARPSERLAKGSARLAPDQDQDLDQDQEREWDLEGPTSSRARTTPRSVTLGRGRKERPGTKATRAEGARSETLSPPVVSHSVSTLAATTFPTEGITVEFLTPMSPPPQSISTSGATGQKHAPSPSPSALREPSVETHVRPEAVDATKVSSSSIPREDGTDSVSAPTTLTPGAPLHGDRGRSVQDCPPVDGRERRRVSSGTKQPVASSASLGPSELPASSLSAEGRELFELMQTHDELRCLSSRFADKLAGESMSSGQSIASMCTAITDAATELAARLEGGDILPADRASLVRRYVAQARRRPDSAQGTKVPLREQTQTLEEISAMYPPVDMSKAVLVPPEKRVPLGQVQALLDSLVAHAGRGGISSAQPPPGTVRKAAPEATQTLAAQEVP